MLRLTNCQISKGSILLPTVLFHYNIVRQSGYYVYDKCSVDMDFDIQTKGKFGSHSLCLQEFWNVWLRLKGRLLL